MARAVWEHTCPATGRTKQRDERWTCFRCRERARLASVSYSMIEQMGKYTRCFGFGSVGPHRPLADKLLNEITVVKCEPCAGTGDRIVGDEDLRDCWPCAGTGIATECWDAIARVRAQVIDAYPKSARPYPPERCSVVWQPRSEPVAMSNSGGSFHAFVIAAILVPLGLGGGVSLLREGRIIDGLFMLYFGGVMAFLALWGADAFTLRLRTGRVILLVLAAVFVVLFLLGAVNAALNGPA
ncbi:MAG: hypothetical protein R6V57_01675 [Vicinamibacterales bacterium]